jgi:hypothetical protein
MDLSDLSPVEIREKGTKAAMRGASRADNPYPSASPEFAAWDQGWSGAEPPPEEPPPPVEAPTG